MSSTSLSTTKKTQPSVPCIYCNSSNTVKRGWREKKHENVQLYLCRSCLRTFTPQNVKGKHYSLAVVIDAMSYYNLGFSLEQSCRIIKQKTDFDISASTVASWIEEYKDLCRYHRFRPFAVKMYSPYHVVKTATLAHRQLYRFMLHRAKIKLIIREDIKHARFGPLADFLALVPSETPHQYFTAESGYQGSRASEAPLKFSKEGMIVRSKNNFANKLAAFVLPSVKKNKDRHEAVQKFMLANDTVTVATEVPVYLRRDDLAHMQSQLGFELYASDVARRRGKSQMPKLQSRQQGMSHGSTTAERNSGTGTANPLRFLTPDELPKLITGHIDLVQVRNGLIHILDYKPNAAKEKPIEQLTLYAMALSRLTGLRMYCFKCAWFDEKDYFEFFPLHVVYKGRGKKRKKRSDRKNIVTKEGVYRLNESDMKIENLRPV